MNRPLSHPPLHLLLQQATAVWEVTKNSFRDLAHKQPGVLFASVTADFRSQLGQRGVDFDVGPRGPVYKKWFDSCFEPRARAKGNSSQLEADRSELSLLI